MRSRPAHTASTSFSTASRSTSAGSLEDGSRSRRLETCSGGSGRRRGPMPRLRDARTRACRPDDRGRGGSEAASCPISSSEGPEGSPAAPLPCPSATPAGPLPAPGQECLPLCRPGKAHGLEPAPIGVAQATHAALAERRLRTSQIGTLASGESWATKRSAGVGAGTGAGAEVSVMEPFFQELRGNVAWTP